MSSYNWDIQLNDLFQERVFKIICKNVVVALYFLCVSMSTEIQ